MAVTWRAGMKQATAATVRNTSDSQEREHVDCCYREQEAARQQCRPHPG